MSNSWFVQARLAAEMDERLTILNRSPQHILLVGADGDNSRSLLAKRFPKASFAETDPVAERLQQSALARKSGWLDKLTGKTVAQFCQPLEQDLPSNQADLLWANLSLLHSADAVSVFENWSNALRKDGLLFFSHLGQDSLAQVREVLADGGVHCAAPLLMDMHDLGDMLFHHGFYDPVMDTARLVLIYRSAAGFWQDFDSLCLWQALRPDDEAKARQLLDDALDSRRIGELVLETVYGHAVKKIRLPDNERPVQFFSSKK